MTATKKKPSATRKKPSKKVAKQPSSFMGRMKTFVVGYGLGVASLAVFNTMGGFEGVFGKSGQQVADDTVASSQKIASQAADQVQQQAKPVFEFYDELKTATVEVDVEPEVGKERKQFDYYLQVASFRNFDDADGLRARLILEGVEVDLKEVNSQKNGRWYRLMAGPFENRSKMASVRGRLAEHELSPIVLKEPKG